MTLFPASDFDISSGKIPRLDLRHTLVVTGAHGFIGTNLLAELLQLGFDALGLKPPAPARFSKGNQAAHISGRLSDGESLGVSVNENNTVMPGRVLTFLAVDLPESALQFTAGRFGGAARVQTVFKDQLLPLLRNSSHPPLAIIHNGACSSTTETRPEVFQNLNVNSTRDLWTYCAQNAVPFLYASSAAVYGDGQQGFRDDPEVCPRYKPLNLYGMSKWEFDMWALEQHQAPPVWYGLRYFNVFGPFEGHKGPQASMVFHGYHQIRERGEVRLFKSNHSSYVHGGQERDFIYVKDVVEVTIACLKRALSLVRQSKKEGCFINVGRGEAVTWNRLIEAVFAAVHVTTKINYVDMPATLAKQYQNFTLADLSTWEKLKINHSCRTIEYAVAEYVQKYLLRGLS